MRIGIDSSALIAYKNRGIGNYAVYLIDYLLRLDDDNKYYILNWTKCSVKHLLLNEYNNLTECCMGNCSDYLPNYYKHYPEKVGRIISAFLCENQIDVFLNIAPFTTFLPPYFRTWFKTTKLVGVLHDLTPLILKEYFFNTEIKFQNYMKYSRNLKQYDFLIADSNSTKKDAIKYLGINKKKYIQFIAIVVVWFFQQK